MNTNKLPMLEGIGHETTADLELAKLPKSERDKHHRKQLRTIQHYQGVDGVRAYKLRYPEAALIRVMSNPIAYSPPPKGYDACLTSLAEKWLTDEEALAQTNKADVEGLNAKLTTDRFNPANHFSKPLNPTRLAKLKAVFLEHGIHLDTDRNNTLSKVKAVAKAARGRQSSGRPFAGIGRVSGNSLIVGNQSINVGSHHGRDCIRVTVNGSRLWLRLDMLEAAISLLFGRAEAEGNPPITITCNIGELDPKPENPDFDPLADEQTGELVPVSNSLPLGEVVPDPTEQPSLSARIAAIKQTFEPHWTACADGVDPLAF